MNTFALILVIVLHMNDCLQMTADIKITGVANSLHHVLSKGLACLQSVDGHGTSFEVKGSYSGSYRSVGRGREESSSVEDSEGEEQGIGS